MISFVEAPNHTGSRKLRAKKRAQDARGHKE